MSECTELDILLHNKSVGILTHLPGDRNIFSFHQEYSNDVHRPTMSLSFKDAFGELIVDTKPTRIRVPSFFANLLPEGHMRTYLAKQAGVNQAREFHLLHALGKDLPGALKAVPLNKSTKTTEPDQEIDKTTGILRFSLAGVQLKFSAILENEGGLTIPVNGVGGAWIVKLPSTLYAGVPENEYAMMELARHIGINVPEAALIPMDQIKGLPKGIGTLNNPAFMIKRFDRDQNGEAIHIEDFAQVFGVFPEKKYQSASYRNIAEVIWNEVGEDGICEFIRRFVFNALIGNGDMHLKNWALIYPDKKHAVLAPAYDFVSTIPYVQDNALALRFVDSKAFSSLDLEDFRRFCAKAKLPETIVLQTVQETVQAFRKIWDAIGDFAIDPNLLNNIKQHLETIPLWKSN